MTLPMLPGSKTSVTARLPRTAASAAPGSVGVEGRHRRQRQHLAGLDVHDRRRCRSRPCASASLSVRTFWAFHCRSRSIVSWTSPPARGSTVRAAAVRDDAAAAVDLGDRPAVRAGQHVVEALARCRRRPAPSTVVKPTTLAARSLPGCTRRGSATMPMPTSPRSRTSLRVVGLEPAGEVGEALAADQLVLAADGAGGLGRQDELASISCGRQVEHRRELRGDAGRVAGALLGRRAARPGDGARLAVDGAGVDRQRQRLAVAVEDLPARRGERDGAGALLDGLRRRTPRPGSPAATPAGRRSA